MHGFTDISYSVGGQLKYFHNFFPSHVQKKFQKLFLASAIWLNMLLTTPVPKHRSDKPHGHRNSQIISSTRSKDPNVCHLHHQGYYLKTHPLISHHTSGGEPIYMNSYARLLSKTCLKKQLYYTGKPENFKTSYI